jgi:hypothetical protein
MERASAHTLRALASAPYSGLLATRPRNLNTSET